MAEAGVDIVTVRHSCAHVMAQAVQDIFPGAKLGIGPTIENGFYYDWQEFPLSRPSIEDVRKMPWPDPADPADLARALSALLDAPSRERAAMRARCLAVTRDRYSWEVAVGPYLRMVEELAPPR